MNNRSSGAGRKTVEGESVEREEGSSSLVLTGLKKDFEKGASLMVCARDVMDSRGRGLAR